MFHYVSTWIHAKFSPRVTWSSAVLNPARAPARVAAMAAKGSMVPAAIALVDGTFRPCARPSQHQESAYNGWKRRHCIKFQSVATPDGMIASLAGPFVGRHNDLHMIAKSNLIAAWASVFLGLCSMFGDEGHAVQHPHIHTPFAGQPAPGTARANFNLATSRVREPVEWPFGGLIVKFPHLDARGNCQLLGTNIGQTCRVAVLLYNCRNCMQPQEVSQHFGCKPPTPEEYLG